MLLFIENLGHGITMWHGELKLRREHQSSGSREVITIGSCACRGNGKGRRDFGTYELVPQRGARGEGAPK